jgi:hypothetical protein
VKQPEQGPCAREEGLPVLRTAGEFRAKKGNREGKGKALVWGSVVERKIENAGVA